MIKRSRVLEVLRTAEIRDRVNLRGHDVKCRPGCGACCTQWIGAQYLEAQEALAEAERVGYQIDTGELERQADLALSPGMTRTKWFGTRCIFLDVGNVCAIYNARPMACRAVSVVSDPAQCAKADAKVSRVDNRHLWQRAGAAIQAEHMQMNLAPVVAALPVMVQVVRDGAGPASLGKSVGVVGLAEIGPDDEVDDAIAQHGS